jgi:predicted DNA binding CopG/RHH family protein
MKKKTIKLDNEEQQLLKDYENNEFESVPNLKKELKKYSEYAKATIKKNKRLNIRITESDLEAIQRKALAEGIPYQTLIASLIHKFVTGKLIEDKKVA